jgi:hypothetical protein
MQVNFIPDGARVRMVIAVEPHRDEHWTLIVRSGLHEPADEGPCGAGDAPELVAFLMPTLSRRSTRVRVGASDRFLSVPTFRRTAAARKAEQRHGVPRAPRALYRSPPDRAFQRAIWCARGGAPRLSATAQ